MEREYVVSFILILLVIFIIGYVAYAYYPQVFDEVSAIAKDVFKYGETEKKIQSTQFAVQSILESLEACQGQNFVGCSCEIKNKKPMAKDYRIFFKVVPGLSGKSDMLIYAFSEQDEIVPIKMDIKGLKLDNMKLGIAYWANCVDCGDAKKYGDIYCVFNSELAGKDTPLMMKGDGQQDWAFTYYNSQGVPFDQLSAGSEYKQFNSIGNVVKLDDNRFCFVTTNLLRPGDDKNFKPLALKKTDDFVKMVNVNEDDQFVLSSKGAVSNSFSVGLKWPPVWIEKEGRELPNMNEVKALGNLRYSFGSCELAKKGIEVWRSSIRDDPSVGAENKELIRPFDWPIKPSRDMKVVCEKSTVNGKTVIDRIKAPMNTPVLASTDSEVLEFCDEKCVPGKKYVILRDKVEIFDRKVQSTGYDFSKDSIIVNSAGELDLQSNLSILLYFGNLNSINRMKVASGSKLLMGDEIGALGDPLDRKGPWLDYRVSYADAATSPITSQFFNYMLGAVRQSGYNIVVQPNYIKGNNYIFVREISPYAKFHASGNKLAKSFYENCDDLSTPNNELDDAINSEANFGYSYKQADFTYEDSGWKDAMKSAQSNNPRNYRNL